MVIHDNPPIEDWEEICDKCKGSGDWCGLHNIILNPQDCKLSLECSESCICPKCRGTGKLDFIEKIVGKKGLNHYREKVINQSNSNILINDLGITIPANKSLIISDITDPPNIKKSKDLKNLINNGSLYFCTELLF